jgi:hypothetical protein
MGRAPFGEVAEAGGHQCQVEASVVLQPMGCPLRNAPPPAVAVNSSSVAGTYTTPTCVPSAVAAAMDTAQPGRP